MIEIRYKDYYKYQLTESYQYELDDLWPTRNDTIVAPYIMLSVTNVLVISKGYAWNGANFAWDTASIMRASLIHDALCQLIRKGILPYNPYRKLADHTFYRICREDGMWWFRAAYTYGAVRVWAMGRTLLNK